jgi:hypothetical protein
VEMGSLEIDGENECVCFEKVSRKCCKSQVLPAKESES